VVEAGKISMDDGYSVWAKQTAVTTTSLWVTADQIIQYTAVGGTAAVQIDATQDNYRVWIDVKELQVASGGQAIRQTGGGRVYIRAEKISSNDLCVAMTGGKLWLTAQKMSAGSGWISVSGTGASIIRANVNHFENTNAVTNGIVTSVASADVVIMGAIFDLCGQYAINPGDGGKIRLINCLVNCSGIAAFCDIGSLILQGTTIISAAVNSVDSGGGGGKLYCMGGSCSNKVQSVAVTLVGTLTVNASFL